jgi:hypothetical protein
VPLPDPLAPPVIVTHATALVAVHAQPAAAVTATLPVDAVAATEALVGATLNVQGTPACVMVTVCPATVSVPVRGDVLVFAATL